jgi:hypothetical protein
MVNGMLRVNWSRSHGKVWPRPPLSQWERIRSLFRARRAGSNGLPIPLRAVRHWLDSTHTHTHTHTHTEGELIVMEASGRYEQLAFLILRPLPNSSLSHPWPMTAENVRAIAPSGAAEPMSDRSFISSLTLPENSIPLTNQIGAHPASTRNTLPRGEGVKNHTQPF